MSGQQTDWADPLPPFALSPNRVDLWRWSLDGPAPEADALALSAEERERAARFLGKDLQRRWTLARHELRRTLSRYLAIDPQSLEFTLNPYGKPEVALRQNSSELRFNLSHSHGSAVLAVTQKHSVGIDLEWIRKDIEIDELAARFFAPSEAGRLGEIPAGESRRYAFFQCWTRKEAYCKARGNGLSQRLDRFVVAFGPDQVPALLSDDEDPAAPRSWAMTQFTPWPGTVGALALEGRDFVVRSFTTSPTSPS